MAMPMAMATGGSFGKDTVDSVAGDVGSLSWVTSLLGILWPRLNESLASLIHDKVTPQLQHALPSPFKGAHFSRFTLGNGVPHYGEIEITQRSDTHVQIEVDLSLSTDADILLDLAVGGICFGIRKIRFSGRLCIALKPLMSQLPLVGAVQVFFAAQPRIEMRFAGLAAIAEIPGLERKLCSVVEDLLRNSIVLPNAKTIQLAKDEQMPNWMEAYSHKPIGALRVQVLRAHHLAGTNWQMGMVENFSSDPYCVLRLGTSSTRTSTVKGSTNPAWPAQEPAAYFPVYHLDQELEVEVRDEGKGFLNTKFVSFLGRMKAKKVRNLLGGGAEAGRAEHRVVLDTSDVNSAMLHINDPVNRGVASELHIVVEWANVNHAASPDRLPGLLGTAAAQAQAAQAAPRDGLSDDMLMVGLHCGEGFPEECMEKGLRWRCSWKGSQEFPVTSQRGTPKTEKLDLEALPTSLRSNSALLGAIDRMIQRGDSIKDVAAIVGFPADAVLQYARAKGEFDRRKRARQQRDHYCLEVQWHQTLPLALPSSPEACLVIELLEGESVIGVLDTVVLESHLREGRALERQSLKLVSRAKPGASMAGFASWLFPECGKPPVENGRFQTASMEVSVRYQHFTRGSFAGPGALGTFGALGALGPRPLDSGLFAHVAGTAPLGREASGESQPWSGSEAAGAGQRPDVQLADIGPGPGPGHAEPAKAKAASASPTSTAEADELAGEEDLAVPSEGAHEIVKADLLKIPELGPGPGPAESRPEPPAEPAKSADCSPVPGDVAISPSRSKASFAGA